MPTLEKKEKKAEQKGDEKEEAQAQEQEQERAEKARDEQRERAVATPTDFAMDFGKGLRPVNSFDASNGKYHPTNEAFWVIIPSCL